MGLGRVLIAMSMMLPAPGRGGVASPAVVAAETSIRLGLTGGYDSYGESVVPRDTERGALLGAGFGIGALRPGGFGLWSFSDLYAGASYNFDAGFLRYRGNLQDAAATPYRASDGAFYNTVIVRLGLGRPLSDGREIIPYVAGGFQNWYRNVGGTSGIGEYYQAGLLGGGLKLDVPVGALFVLSASAEGLAVVGGTVTAPSEAFHGGFGTSAEERVRLDADYRLGGSWHAFAGLSAVHYNYAGSKAGSDGLYEPLSSTLQLESTIGVAFGF